MARIRRGNTGNWNRENAYEVDVVRVCPPAAARGALVPKLAMMTEGTVKLLAEIRVRTFQRAALEPENPQLRRRKPLAVLIPAVVTIGTVVQQVVLIAVVPTHLLHAIRIPLLGCRVSARKLRVDALVVGVLEVVLSLGGRGLLGAEGDGHGVRPRADVGVAARCDARHGRGQRRVAPRRRDPRRRRGRRGGRDKIGSAEDIIVLIDGESELAEARLGCGAADEREARGEGRVPLILLENG